MKYVLIMCCLAILVGCATHNNHGAGIDQPSNQISTHQLIEAFITYVHKAEKPETDKKDEMRRELQEAKNDPLLAPYIFEGNVFDREMIMDKIGQAKAKWLSFGIPLSVTAKYASETSNLEMLSDAELVIAFRLMNQVASQIK